MTWKSVTSEVVQCSHLGMLVDNLDDDRFDATLLELFCEISPAAELNGFKFPRGSNAPLPLSWHGFREGTANRIERYARGYFRFDPTLVSLPPAPVARQAYVHSLEPMIIGNAAYRRICFEEPSFSQKISIASTCQDGAWTVLNIYFGQPCYRATTIQQVIDLGLLAAPFLRRRATYGRPAKEVDRPDERLARRLGLRYPELTARERHVCALTMIGKSSGEIATALGIRAGTVLTYRRRAYERLGVSSAATLVAELV